MVVPELLWCFCSLPSLPAEFLPHGRPLHLGRKLLSRVVLQKKTSFFFFGGGGEGVARVFFYVFFIILPYNSKMKKKKITFTLCEAFKREV